MVCRLLCWEVHPEVVLRFEGRVRGGNRRKLPMAFPANRCHISALRRDLNQKMSFHHTIRPEAAVRAINHLKLKSPGPDGILLMKCQRPLGVKILVFLVLLSRSFLYIYIMRVVILSSYAIMQGTMNFYSRLSQSGFGGLVINSLVACTCRLMLIA